MTAPWDRRRPAEQRRVLDLQLASWLPQAVGFTQAWSEVSSRLGMEPSGVGDLDDLRRFPASRERDLLLAGGVGAAALLMRPTERQVKALADTTTLRSILSSIRSDGEAGRRAAVLEEYKPIHVHRAGVGRELAIAYTRSDLDRLHRTGARAATVLGLHDADYLVSALPPGPRIDWWGVYHLALASSMLALHPRGHGDPLDAVAPAFDLVPATAVAVAAHEAVGLAAALIEEDVGLERVGTVVTVGPPPTDDERAEIAEAWLAAGANERLRVRALWAPSLGRALWAECAAGTTGLHTYPDLEHLEVLDPITGRTTGGDGDLTVTSVGWNGTALLRARSGTWVEALATDPCPACGRTVPRVVGEVVPAAWQPTLAAPGRDQVVDLRGVAAALQRSGVATWRVELRPPGDGADGDRLVVGLGGDVSEGTAAAVHRDVTEAGGVAPHTIEVTADPALVDAAAAEAGSRFADLR